MMPIHCELHSEGHWTLHLRILEVCLNGNKEVIDINKEMVRMNFNVKKIYL